MTQSASDHRRVAESTAAPQLHNVINCAAGTSILVFIDRCADDRHDFSRMLQNSFFITLMVISIPFTHTIFNAQNRPNPSVLFVQLWALLLWYSCV